MEIKEKILKSSIKLFMENGFFEVSIRDIFKQININKSAFYKYFKSKDELIYKVIEEFCSPYFDEIIGATNLCNESTKKAENNFYKILWNNTIFKKDSKYK